MPFSPHLALLCLPFKVTFRLKAMQIESLFIYLKYVYFALLHPLFDRKRLYLHII